MEGRLLIIKAVFESHTMVFLNVYAPTNGADSYFFLAKLMVLNDMEAESFLFVGGDFNCTVDDKLDRNHLEPHAPSQNAVI